MIINCKGIQTDTFYLPPFELNESEIVILQLFNGVHFHETRMFLKDVFCGNTPHDNVSIYKKPTFVEHFFEPRLRYYFYPVTVGEYLRKNANPNSQYATKIYENKWINPKTKVNRLPGSPRGLLRTYATLSRTNHIVFDLLGQDPHGAQITYETVKQVVKEGGSAILLDFYEEMRYDCTKYIELQWTTYSSSAKAFQNDFKLKSRNNE